MKKYLIGVFAAVLNCLYGLMKLLPVQKKITYISRQSNELSVDFRLIINEMKRRHPEYENVALIKMIGKSVPDKIGYGFHMLRQMYHAATSEMVVLDTYCIIISLLKQRKSLKVIQMWHALGAMKKFGYSILDKGEGTQRSLAESMKMHKNYTYVFSSSVFCSRFFAEAFHVSMDHMVVMPLPRLDLLLDDDYSGKIEMEITKQYPQLLEKRKKTIVYAPTFRKDGGDFEEEELRIAAEMLADSVDYDRYNLVMKFHPLSKIEISNKSVIQDAKFSTIDFCRVADFVILDYSAVVFEAVMLGKPLYFYTFDYDAYMENRDVYIDFRKYVPGMIAETPGELMSAIDSGTTHTEKLEAFRTLMISKPRGTSYTDDVIDFFEKILVDNHK